MHGGFNQGYGGHGHGGPGPSGAGRQIYVANVCYPDPFSLKSVSFA